MSTEPDRLARAMGHAFADIALLEQALTHRSASSANNERLEFLGDALIGFVIAEALWQRFPKADEGTLSRMRASLVKREALSKLARGVRLGDYLKLGAGELRSGGHARDSILADALEAVLGAVYLDAGFEPTRRVVLGLFNAALAQTDIARAGKDPKTRLQELLQSRKRPLPEYVVLAVDGDQHDQTFTVGCTLQDGSQSSRGVGTSRRRAEQAAAQDMLEQIADV